MRTGTLDPWHKLLNPTISKPPTVILERGKGVIRSQALDKEIKWFELAIGSSVKDWPDGERVVETVLVSETILSTWPEANDPKGEYR
jgi:hypothetical protein